MAGNREGALRAAETIKKKYGLTADGKSKLHSRIGSVGGSSLTETPKGFAAMKANGKLWKVKEAGRRGGHISRRTYKKV